MDPAREEQSSEVGEDGDKMQQVYTLILARLIRALYEGVNACASASKWRLHPPMSVDPNHDAETKVLTTHDIPY